MLFITFLCLSPRPAKGWRFLALSRLPRQVDACASMMGLALRTQSGWGKPRCPPKRPERLMADRDYNSHSLRVRLARCGVAPSIPAGVDAQTGRAGWGTLGRYRRRRRVERTSAWLELFRPLVVCVEWLSTVYAGFLHLACTLLTLGRVLGDFNLQGGLFSAYQ